jgi:hypothetical protein
MGRTKGHEVSSKPFAVWVRDNFHYMDETEQYKQGEYVTYEEALEVCNAIVQASLDQLFVPGMSADKLLDQYVLFGDDPVIVGPQRVGEFSAWTYAKDRGAEMCAGDARP